MAVGLYSWVVLRNLAEFTINMDTAIVLNQLDLALSDFNRQFEPPKIEVLPYFSFDHSSQAENRLFRRSACPSGVGRFGFNSFNFLTFMVMVFNAVANVNNNINNNNNNNNDFNLNSISQDSNSVVSNSDNQNTIMAMILPVPGRRRKRSSGMQCIVQEAWKSLKAEIEGHPQCSQYFICSKLLDIRDSLPLSEIMTGDNGRTLLRSDCPQKYCANLLYV